MVVMKCIFSIFLLMFSAFPSKCQLILNQTFDFDSNGITGRSLTAKCFVLDNYSRKRVVMNIVTNELNGGERQYQYNKYDLSKSPNNLYGSIYLYDEVIPDKRQFAVFELETSQMTVSDMKIQLRFLFNPASKWFVKTLTVAGFSTYEEMQQVIYSRTFPTGLAQSVLLERNDEWQVVNFDATGSHRVRFVVIGNFDCGYDSAEKFNGKLSKKIRSQDRLKFCQIFLDDVTVNAVLGQ